MFLNTDKRQTVDVDQTPRSCMNKDLKHRMLQLRGQVDVSAASHTVAPTTIALKKASGLVLYDFRMVECATTNAENSQQPSIVRTSDEAT